jgi:hypothetical protein
VSFKIIKISMLLSASAKVDLELIIKTANTNYEFVCV